MTSKQTLPIPSFPNVKTVLGLRGFDEGHSTLTLSRHGLVRLLQPLIDTRGFDEPLYLDLYPDVLAAVENGEIESGIQHYIEFGYFEGRFPGFRDFDPDAYLDANPDLAVLRSAPDPAEAAREHYMRTGFAEGRPTTGIRR